MFAAEVFSGGSAVRFLNDQIIKRNIKIMGYPL